MVYLQAIICKTGFRPAEWFWDSHRGDHKVYDKKHILFFFRQFKDWIMTRSQTKGTAVSTFFLTVQQAVFQQGD
jgi:hypothetical protein